MWWSNRSKYSLLWCVLYVCMIVAFSSWKHKLPKLIYKLTLLEHEDKATPKIYFHVTLPHVVWRLPRTFQIYFYVVCLRTCQCMFVYLIPVAHSANRYEAMAIVDTTRAMPA